MTRKKMEMEAIGYVRASEREMFLEIMKPYQDGLKELGDFSHVHVFWWATENDNSQMRKKLLTQPPYAKDHTTGIFATRAEYRPNPIALTTCYILDVDMEKGIVAIPYIDAHDGTPIVDLKAYFPISDRVRNFHYPEWLSHWPEYVPESPDEVDFEALGLMD